VSTSSSLHESDNFDQFCSSTGRHILFVHFSFSFSFCVAVSLYKNIFNLSFLCVVRFLYSLSIMYDSSLRVFNELPPLSLSHFYTSSFSRVICYFGKHHSLRILFPPPPKFAAVFSVTFSPLPFLSKFVVYCFLLSSFFFLFFSCLFLSSNLQPFAGGTKEPLRKRTACLYIV